MHLLKGKGLGSCARQLLKQVATVHSMDVVLPERATPESEPTDLRLRAVARPDEMVADLLAAPRPRATARAESGAKCSAKTTP